MYMWQNNGYSTTRLANVTNINNIRNDENESILCRIWIAMCIYIRMAGLVKTKQTNMCCRYNHESKENILSKISISHILAESIKERKTYVTYTHREKERILKCSDLQKDPFINWRTQKKKKWADLANFTENI